MGILYFRLTQRQTVLICCQCLTVELLHHYWGVQFLLHWDVCIFTTFTFPSQPIDIHCQDPCKDHQRTLSYATCIKWLPATQHLILVFHCCITAQRYDRHWDPMEMTGILIAQLSYTAPLLGLKYGYWFYLCYWLSYYI